MIYQDNETIKTFENNLHLIEETFIQIACEKNSWLETHLYQGNWSAIPLKYNYKFIKNTNLDVLLDTASIAMFSILSPGTKILKHRGHLPYAEHIWRYHMCLSHSEDNKLIVEEDVFQWHRGKCFYFDDSKEHWGWNNGSVDRVVLLFDIPRTDYKPTMTEKMRQRFENT